MTARSYKPPFWSGLLHHPWVRRLALFAGPGPWLFGAVVAVWLWVGQVGGWADVAPATGNGAFVLAWLLHWLQTVFLSFWLTIGPTVLAALVFNLLTALLMLVLHGWTWHLRHTSQAPYPPHPVVGAGVGAVAAVAVLHGVWVLYPELSAQQQPHLAQGLLWASVGVGALCGAVAYWADRLESFNPRTTR